MSMRPGGSLELLRMRDFRLLFIGQGVSGLGDRMRSVALAFALHASLWIASALFAVAVAVLMAVPDVWRFHASRVETTVP